MANEKPGYHHGDLRARLIAQGREVVQKGGMDAVRLRALAARLSITHTAVYAHFRTKDALLAAILTDAYHRLAEGVRRADPGDGAVADRLARIAVSYVAFARKEQGVFLAMVGPRLNAANAYPELQAALADAWDYVSQIVDTAGPEGLPLGPATAVAFWAALQGVATQVVLGRFRLSPDEECAFVTRFTLALCDGLGLG